MLEQTSVHPFVFYFFAFLFIFHYSGLLVILNYENLTQTLLFCAKIKGVTLHTLSVNTKTMSSWV